MKFAVRTMTKAAKKVCEQANVEINDVDIIIPHQANIRIIESATKLLKVDVDKIFVNLEKYGNTSSASIPVAVCEAVESGRLKRGNKFIIVGFGGGLTWGAALIEY